MPDLMRKILQQAGFRGDSLRTALAVAMAESGGRATAHNPNRATGDDSYGIFQINMLDDLGPDRRRRYGLGSNQALFDPATNARVAYAMSKGGTDWSPWSAYKSGAYKKFLGQPAALLGELGADGASEAPAAAAAAVSPGHDPRQVALSLLAQRRPSRRRGLIQELAGRQDAPAEAVMESGPEPGRTGGAPAGPMGGLRELFYDPKGGYDEGKFIGPIGGHGRHMHAAVDNPKLMLWLIKDAQRRGLSVRENPYTDPVDPVHTKGSFHYSNFPGRYDGKPLGRAVDISGDPAKLAALWDIVLRRAGVKR